MSVAEIEVRRVLRSDAGVYRDIRMEALKLDPEAFGSTFGEESAHPLQWFADRLNNSAVFGAFIGIELVGIAGFSVRQGRKEAHKGVLWGMYVRPNARRSGIGRQLVETVIDHACRLVEVLQLTVVASNEQARLLYTGIGFIEYGVEKNSLKQDARYWDEILMAKQLSPNEAARS